MTAQTGDGVWVLIKINAARRSGATHTGSHERIDAPGGKAEASTGKRVRRIGGKG